MNQTRGGLVNGLLPFPLGDGLAELLERSSEAAFVIDGAQRILAWNSQAVALMGRSPEEAVGRCCYELVAGTTLDGRRVCGLDCPALGYFEADHPFRATLLVAAAGGAPRPVQETTLVLPGPMEAGVPKVVVFLSPLEGGRPLAEGREAVLPPAAAPPLTVHALGALGLQVGGRELRWQRWPRRQAATLFKFLLTRRGQPVHRQALLAVLWPGAPPRQGYQRLKVLVHALRRYLEPGLGRRATSRFIVTDGECYRLAPGPHLWLDVDRFQELLREGQQALDRGQKAEALLAFEEAALLCQGDYLAEGPDDGWVVEERERLRELALSLLERMASLYAESRRLDEAIAACRRALALDPGRERVHRALMAYLWAAGQRGEALRQYQACATVLRETLGVPPLPETQRLYAALVAGVSAPPDVVEEWA